MQKLQLNPKWAYQYISRNTFSSSWYAWPLSIPLITSQLKQAKSLAICSAIGEKIRFFFSFPVENCLHCTAMLSKLFLAACLLRHFMAAWGILTVWLINNYNYVSYLQPIFKRNFDCEAFKRSSENNIFIHFNLDLFWC